LPTFDGSLSETNIMKPSNYREKNAMSYTRKEYIGGIPGSKIVKFTMGNTSRDFTHTAKIR